MEEWNKEELYSSSFRQMNKKEKLIWLMDEYGQTVMRLAFIYVRDKQIAEDITQDVFIKCFEKMDDFKEESSYKTWIFKITINKCKDYLKSWSYRNIKMTNYFKSRTQKSIESEILTKEENISISNKVITLPIKYKEVIIFYYYEELTIKDISRLLGMNKNTIKSRLVRGRRLLKKMLKGEYYNGK
ncbi:sigma-70 family RNA polymerase sigma factor [Cytobacillus kochii]|uniref:RNA polymerase subunit sigma n=1 Tax=Cytobacillus kochii TaxID=859143 RepID=A0A248TH52_9BACI|nr:sigma-70 family RNA polymerase sigma factor [Cytobacillus kochii]ASV67544.1 RNA polymerase subunit sigma [Cytobacillus kochii]